VALVARSTNAKKLTDATKTSLEGVDCGGFNEMLFYRRQVQIDTSSPDGICFWQYY